MWLDRYFVVHDYIGPKIGVFDKWHPDHRPKREGDKSMIDWDNLTPADTDPVPDADKGKGGKEDDGINVDPSVIDPGNNGSVDKSGKTKVEPKDNSDSDDNDGGIGAFWTIFLILLFFGGAGILIKLFGKQCLEKIEDYRAGQTYANTEYDPYGISQPDSHTNQVNQLI